MLGEFISLEKLGRSKIFFYLLFVAIFTIAVLLRFYNFNLNSIKWAGDQAWDLIVAKNILYYHHRPLVGPVLWMPNFYIPPTYYYFLAFLLLVGKTPEGVTLLFQFMNILSMIVIFLLIRVLIDKWAGLAGVLLFAVSREMVYQSRTMWQPYPLTLFIILALYFLVLAFKKRKMLFLWISYTSYFIALSIYPGPVVLAPYFVWQLIRFRKRLKDKTRIRHFKITSIFCLVSFLLIYVPQFYFEFQNKFPTIKTFLMPNMDYFSERAGISSRLEIYLENMQSLFASFFRINAIFDYTKYVTTFFMIIFFILLFYGLKNFKKLPSKMAKKYEFSLQIIALPWLMIGSFSFLWFRMDSDAHRSLAYLPFLFIIVALLFRLAFELKKVHFKAAISLILLITIVANLKLVSSYINHTSFWFPTTHRVVEYIISDINKEKLDIKDTTTYLVSPGDFYGNDVYPILYFLQERVNYPVNFLDAGNDVDRGALLHAKTPVLYLICQLYEARNDVKEFCLHRFLQVNSVYRPIAYKNLNFRYKVFKLVSSRVK